MASAAQLLANQANAQHSTGPQSASGKARATRNNIKHGLSFGLLVRSAEEQAYILQFEAKMRAEMQPSGAIEEAAFAQFIDAASRLYKIHALQAALAVPETEAEWNQLTRYRAAAEMQLYSAVNILSELQTSRLFRAFHLTAEEQSLVPPLVKGSVQMWLDEDAKGYNDRELFYAIYDVAPFLGRLAQIPPGPNGFAGANPIAA